jgi:pSer/pThr/pTyr-binding forkhead associated (FHA) protein
MKISPEGILPMEKRIEKAKNRGGHAPVSCGTQTKWGNMEKEQNRKRSGASLGVLVRRDNGQGFRIREEVVIIGRHYDCDIRIEKPCVSRVHAVVCRENRSLVLEDMGGKNGTRVNRVAVSRKVLADGDRIHIGRVELVFKSV